MASSPSSASCFLYSSYNLKDTIPSSTAQEKKSCTESFKIMPRAHMKLYLGGLISQNFII